MEQTFFEAIEQYEVQMAAYVEEQDWASYYETRSELASLCSVMRRET